MSAQAGVFYFDGRPVAPDVIALLGRALDDYGPDDGGHLVRPGLAMVHRALHVTPEDPGTRQPLTSARGNILTWDGRLDNRTDLRLQLWHDRDEDVSDAALALRVYEKWGADGFIRLIGDWSLVIWDAAQHAVVMASDYMGVRPLHYCRQRDGVSWSTTLEGLVRLHALYDEIDPRYLVGLLAYARPAGVTPYTGVRAVPTGQSVTFTRAGAADTRRFWQLDPPEIRYRDPADYEAHLRCLIFDAVRQRLRATGPVWAQLSGGLDSSAVVCAADAVLKQGTAIAPDVCTVSFVTDGSPEADERRFVACVDEQCGRVTHLVQQDHVLHRLEHARHWISPSQPAHASLQAFDLIQRSGSRVLLTGVGGDSVLGNFADLHHDVSQRLRRLQPVAAVALARQRALAAKRSIWDVLSAASLELLPVSWIVRRLVSQALVSGGGPAAVTDAHVADTFLLKPEYAVWWREDWRAQSAYGLTFPDLSKRLPVSQLLMLAEHRHAQALSDVPAALATHPLLDRTLVEFMLGVPIGIVAPPGQPRGLMRRACAPFMPPRIIARFSKNFTTPFYMRNTRDLLLEWLVEPDRLKILQLPFLDRGRVLPYLERLRDTGKQPELFVQLLKIEQWLQSRARMPRDARDATSVARATGERARVASAPPPARDVHPAI